MAKQTLEDKAKNSYASFDLMELYIKGEKREGLQEIVVANEHCSLDLLKKAINVTKLKHIVVQNKTYKDYILANPAASNWYDNKILYQYWGAYNIKKLLEKDNVSIDADAIEFLFKNNSFIHHYDSDLVESISTIVLDKIKPKLENKNSSTDLYYILKIFHGKEGEELKNNPTIRKLYNGILDCIKTKIESFYHDGIKPTGPDDE